MTANARLIGIVSFAAAVAAGGTLFGMFAVPAEHHAEAGEHHEAEAEHGDVLRASELAGALLVSIAGIGLVPVARRSLRRAQQIDAAVAPPERERVDALRLTVALASAGAATIHFAVIAQHFEEYWLFGTFFVAVGLLQLGWAVLVVARPSRGVYLAGAVGNVVVAAMWVVSRTAGLPLGPEAGEPEPVGITDTMATAYEVALAAGALALLRVTGPARPSARFTAAAGVTTLAAVALTTLSLLSLAGL